MFATAALSANRGAIAGRGRHRLANRYDGGFHATVRNADPSGNANASNDCGADDGHHHDFEVGPTIRSKHRGVVHDNLPAPQLLVVVTGEKVHALLRKAGASSCGVLAADLQ